MKIAYQGIEGSYSHQAIFHLDGEKVGLPTFREVYEAVAQGDVDLGLLPIENALAGTIYETIDLLNAGELKIVGELYTKVEHCLMALSGACLEKVLSHPQALAQCHKFFAKHPHYQAVPHCDTAGAALEVAQSNDLTLAAIASRKAAAIYGLEIIEAGIQDHKENYTRFFLISKTATHGEKGSYCFTLEHQPGKLAERLQLFANQGINLTHLVSRPVPGKPFEYLFYVDLEGPKPTANIKHLGSYETISHWQCERKS